MPKPGGGAAIPRGLWAIDPPPGPIDPGPAAGPPMGAPPPKMLPRLPCSPGGGPAMGIICAPPIGAPRLSSDIKSFPRCCAPVPTLIPTLGAAPGRPGKSLCAFTFTPFRGPGAPPPRVGHPFAGGSAKPRLAAGPSKFTNASSRSSSPSAHTTRPTANVPSRSALSTLGKDLRCTARATLSPAANGSSTPRQYRPGAHEHPAVHLPAYALATKPCLHSGSTARKCVKKVTRSSARVAPLFAPHPRHRRARRSTGAMSRIASLCCRIFDTGNFRMGSRLAARSFSAARSASAAASVCRVSRMAGGRIGGDRVCRWNSDMSESE